MITDDLCPITRLTEDVIRKMKIHPTVDVLRRSIGSYPNVRIDGSKYVPTLFYIKDRVTPDHKDEWSIHALVTDISRYLLLKSTLDDSDNYVRSAFRITTEGLYVNFEHHIHPLTNNVSTCAQIKGIIPYDECTNTNYLDFMIVPDSAMINEYSLPRFETEDEKFTVTQDGTSGTILGRLTVITADQDSYMRLNWTGIHDNEFNPEEFGLELVDCQLESR